MIEVNMISMGRIQTTVRSLGCLKTMLKADISDMSVDALIQLLDKLSQDAAEAAEHLNDECIVDYSKYVQTNL